MKRFDVIRRIRNKRLVFFYKNLDALDLKNRGHPQKNNSFHHRQRCFLFRLVFLATERSSSLDEFLQRLLEQPISQHYHSVSINKHQLIERYEEAVRELQQRYPTFFGNAPEQLTSSVRSLNSNDPRASSPMQQDDDQQDAPTHP